MSKRIENIFYTLCGVAGIYGGMTVLRSHNSGKKYEGEEKLFGKTAVVTGSNTGVGKEVAKNLAKRGARVIMACRDMKKCSEARDDIINETFNKNVECMECDLASLESIKNFVDNLKQKEKYLNILVNNAGVMWCPKGLTKEGFEKHLGINHLGHFYLTNLLLEKLGSSTSPRIVNVSCKSYKKGDIIFDDLNSSKFYEKAIAYYQSKLANVLFTLELNEKLKHTNVNVFTADPGYVYSNIMRHSSFDTSSFNFLAPFVKTFMKTPEMGAQTIIRCCVDESINNKESSGKYFRDNESIEISENGLNTEDAKRLWAISEKWTRLK